MSGVITSALSAYPNPFNSAVTISVGCRGLINQTPTVEIFDIAGRRVADIPVGDAYMRPAGGTYAAPTTWEPDVSVGSGIYLVRAKVGDKEVTKRVVYLK